MSVSNQQMPTKTMDDDFKKPGPKALQLNKKSMAFLVFAIMLLQVVDTCFQWLGGSSKDAQYSDAGLLSYIFPAMVFFTLKCTYDKYYKKKSGKSCGETDDVSQEAMTDDATPQPATMVVDRFHLKAPQQSVPHDGKTQNLKKGRIASPDQARNRSWIPKWLRAEFTHHLRPSTNLHSDAPVFMPNQYAQEEKQLLRETFAVKRAGDVVYRSTHWMNAIGSRARGIPTAPKAQVKPATPSTKKWVPKARIVWASPYSTAKALLA